MTTYAQNPKDTEMPTNFAQYDDDTIVAACLPALVEWYEELPDDAVERLAVAHVARYMLEKLPRLLAYVRVVEELAEDGRLDDFLVALERGEQDEARSLLHKELEAAGLRCHLRDRPPAAAGPQKETLNHG